MFIELFADGPSFDALFCLDKGCSEEQISQQSKVVTPVFSYESLLMVCEVFAFSCCFSL